MKRQLTVHLVGITLLLAVGCASKPKVWVPPRVDLHRYGTLGLIEFPSRQGHGPVATERFLAHVHGAQAGVPVLELGSLHHVLHSVGHRAMGPEAVRAIGEKYRVDAVVVGDLQIDQPRPNFSIRSLTEAKASAEIHGTLNARILDARSGATIWSDEARGKRTLAHLGMRGGAKPSFGAVDPQGEHAKLVVWLVEQVTGDFRGYWAR